MVIFAALQDFVDRVSAHQLCRVSGPLNFPHLERGADRLGVDDLQLAGVAPNAALHWHDV